MIKFSKWKYVRPDAAHYNAIYSDITSRIEKAESLEALEALIAEYDAIGTDVMTMTGVAYIRNRLNMEDAFYKEESAACNKFYRDTDSARETLMKAVLASPHLPALEEKYGSLMIQKLRNFTANENSAGNKALEEREDALTSEYNELLHSIRVPFEGHEYTQHEMGEFKQDPDDARRQAAWHASGLGYASVGDRLDAIFDELVHVRTQMAHEAGYKDYVDMAYVLRGRYCFNKKDIEEFRDAVVKYYVPLQEKLARQQAERLGVKYPMNFSENTMPFREGLPQPIGTKEDTLNTALQIFRELSPETAEFVDYMQRYELMDTSTSRQKSGGGFCIDLPAWKAGFLFSHFSGTIADVNSIRHEGGHAFAAYISERRGPRWRCMYTQEIAETHSQGMEVMTLPYIERFFGDKADAFRYSMIADWISFVPYACLADHFQQAVYEQPDLTPAERHALWRSLMERYMPWIRFGEIAFYGDGKHWQRQPHIYTSPFYFIDYCLSEIVALQFFALQCVDRRDAWEKYLMFVKLGGTKNFVELALAVGMESPLSAEGVRHSAEQIFAWLNSVDVSKIK